MRKALFFIAIIPPGNIEGELMDFKKYAARHFSTKKALNSPGHVTLQAPFKYEERAISDVLLPLYELAEDLKPFYLTFNGLDHFDKRVLFVDVENSPELIEMQQRVSARIAEILDLPTEKRKFHPHATVAFRDLTRENFNKAWTHFKSIDYLRVFEVKDFYLLQHDGKRWEVKNRFLMKP
jgi:2'-5' RNA ligase